MCLVAQSRPTLRNLMDHSPPGSSVHGIFQARILEWVAIAFSKSKELASFNLMAAVTVYNDFVIIATASSFSPSICHEVLGPDTMILV